MSQLFMDIRTFVHPTGSYQIKPARLTLPGQARAAGCRPATTELRDQIQQSQLKAYLENEKGACAQFCVHGHVWFHDLVENMSGFASTHQRVLLTFIFTPVS